VIGADNDHVIVARPEPGGLDRRARHRAPARGAGPPHLHGHDHRPTHPQRPEGLAPFYVVIGWVVGGYLVASLLALARAPSPAFAGSSCGSGPWPPSPCSRASSARCSWARRCTSSRVTSGRSPSSGPWWSSPRRRSPPPSRSSSASSGSRSPSWSSSSPATPRPGPLPEGAAQWRVAGHRPYLPNGAGLDAVRNIGYFGSADLASSIWVLLVYSALGWARCCRDLVAGRARAAAPGLGRAHTAGRDGLSRTWGRG